MALNKKRQTVATRAKPHVNHEGGISYDIKDPFTQLRIVATSCFFGEPAFYVSGESKKSPSFAIYDHQRLYTEEGYGKSLLPISRNKTTRQLMEAAIDAALNVDIERTLQFAVELRRDWNIRATPQVIMVRAAMHPKIKNTGLLKLYSDSIMTRLDEVMNQMAYFESVQGSLKRIPSRLKRVWAARLSQANEYELAKYKMMDRSVNVFDAVRLTHPNGEAIDKLIEGKVSLSNENTETWESIRSGGGTWTNAAKVMGHMALLRNLRNLHEDGSLSDKLLDKLLDGVENGKQLPFRYFSAFKAIGAQSGKVADTLEECLERSIKYSVPRFEGRGLTICDVSGSMDGGRISESSDMTFKEIAVLMSAVTTRAFEDGGDTLLFASTTEFYEPRRKTSIFTEMEKMFEAGNRLGGGTNIVNAFYEIIKHKKKYDTIFVYSDMQCGYETNVPKLVKEYRQNVNPDVQIFFVNLAGYQDALVPEFFENTYLLGGWSDKMLQFADKIIGLTTNEKVI